MDIQNKKSPMGWLFMAGGLLITVGLFGFIRSANPKWSLGTNGK